VKSGRKKGANRNDVHCGKGNCPVTIGEDAILRRAEELGPSFRSAGSELLTDDDVATLTRLAGEGMGTLDCLQAVDLAFRLLLTGREALNLPMETTEHQAVQTIVGDAAGRSRGQSATIDSPN